MTENVNKRFLSKWYLPKFIREDYSPYKYNVSSNRENYNLRARLVHLQNLVKTWVNTGRFPFTKPVECKECLFDTRVPNIYIGPEGLCNMCMTYKKNYKEEILQSELQTFINTPRENDSPYDAVVAFSGGKDSAAALYMAREKLKMDVVAVLVDNGFIPEAVIENGRKLCDKLGCELVVLRIDFAPLVKEMMENNFKYEYPCYKCGEMFHEEIKQYCIRNKINRVILGRNWWRWLEPEVRSVRWMKDEKSGFNMQFMSLPFALHLTEKAVLELLDQLHWSTIKIQGNSTNCLLPGLVEFPIYKRLGYHPELNLMSREVISGFLSKEEAKEQLSSIKDKSVTLTKLVNKRLDEHAV